jgi:membrane protein
LCEKQEDFADMIKDAMTYHCKAFVFLSSRATDASALLLQGARSGLAFYLASMPTFTLIYGTFATVPILLVWVYTTWVVVLLGAVVVASWPELAQDLLAVDKPLATQGMALGLACMRLLHQARAQSAGGMAAARLAQQLNADPMEVEKVLGLLSQLDWVGVLNEPQTPRYVLLIDLAELN